MAILSYMTPRTVECLPDVFTHAEAINSGISDRLLYQMRDRGEIDRVARGIYARHGLQADHHLIEIATRAPEATLCLTSALARHGLTDDIPPRINVALPRSRRQPRVEAPVTWHRFDANTYSIGRSMIPVTDQIAIGIYDPTRTIVDAYRLRHLYGMDQALEALKRWIRVRGNQPADLLETARQFPTAAPAVRLALEVLL